VIADGCATTEGRGSAEPGPRRFQALRFTAYGKRRYVTFGSPEDGWSEARAAAELAEAVADGRQV
jgi:hypothetical protein